MVKMDTVQESALVVSHLLSQEEWNEIPTATAKKLDEVVREKFEEFLTSKALLETKRYNAEESLKQLKDDYETLRDENQTLKSKCEATENTLETLESQIINFNAETARLQATCNKLEEESAEYRHQRNLAVDERDENLKMLQRRDAEIERMQADLKLLMEQLEGAVNAKCEALAKIDAVDSLKLTLEYKEKRIEMERSLLAEQVTTLTTELQQRTEELLNMRRDNTSRCIQLETQLNSKMQELAVAVEQIKSLTELNSNLNNRIEELSQNILSQREAEEKTNESYSNEIEANTKIANTYKDLYEESQLQAEKLKEALEEVQQLLQNATIQYGELETKHKESELIHEDLIAKKNEALSILKVELEAANELLLQPRNLRISNGNEELSMNDTRTSDIIKTGMPYTEVYSKYVAATEKSFALEEENLRLNNYLNSIDKEIAEKGPQVTKLRENYVNVVDANEELKLHNESLMNELQHLRDVNTECLRAENTAGKENIRLKQEIADLSRQVCHLLQEMEMSRIGSSYNSSEMDYENHSSSDIISKKLVTFSDITELQQNNQKLLAVVRELTDRQEEAEQISPDQIAELQSKMESMRQMQTELLEERDKQNKMMETLKNQRNMYKNLYAQTVKDTDSIETDRNDNNSTDSDKIKGEGKSQESQKVKELENQIELHKQQIAQLKQDKDEIREEKSSSDKIYTEQLDEARRENKELMQQNCKLLAQAELNEEKLKMMKNNADIYKKQINALEKQNRIFNESLLKTEQNMTYLRDETLKCQTKLTTVDVMLSNLQKENALLKDSEARLLKERESSKQKNHAQNLIHSNIELIKASLERADSEGRLRLEARLDEAHRECSAIRRRLEEEQDRFRQLSEHLQAQTESMNKRYEEEKVEADKLRAELIELRRELSEKSNQIGDLTKKLKLSIVAMPESSGEGKKVRLLEQQLADAQGEITTLQSKLALAKEAKDQYYNVSSEFEKQLQIVLDQVEAHKQEVEKEKKTVKDLEEKCAELQAELSIQMDDQDVQNIGKTSKVTLLEEELNVKSLDLETARKELEILRTDYKALVENVKVVENKYAREVALHSADLKALTELKEHLDESQNELKSIVREKDEAVQSLQIGKSSWENQEALFLKEKAELEQRVEDIDSQNKLLLDQIQAFNAQMSIIQAQANDSLNQSGDAQLNRSFAEDEMKSSEQLLKIIKYIRQEKDIAVSKSEILEAEHMRIKSQLEIVTKQMEEAKATMEAERQKTEISVVTAAKHAELLRRVETMNAITDSNRLLRKERDTLCSQNSELQTRIEQLVNQMAPTEEKNIELVSKLDALQAENISLRAECTRWRQRANTLIEKSNRTSPEDWKKLQNERDTLIKQLNIEKANNIKFSEESNILRADKSRLEEQLKSLRLQNSSLAEELSQLKETVKNLQTQVSDLSTSLQESQQEAKKVSEEVKVLTDDTAKKEHTISDLRNNLVQVRKIAKKYKTQCEDQVKEIEGLKEQIQSKEVAQDESQQREEKLKQEQQTQMEERLGLEQTHKETIEGLNAQLNEVTEEIESYKTEIQSLKNMSIEKEERFKSLFKNAKERIVALTEHNKQLENELKLSQDGGTAPANPGEGTSAMSNSELLAKIETLLKEKDEMIAGKAQDREKFNAEIELLNQKLAQLQRQVGSQQGTKPATSSTSVEKSTTEPPTANIKPMAGHSTNTQTQSVPIQPWRNAGETPLASIRPMSAQLRTVAVPPTSQSPSAVMVPPQQQQVHTTGSTTTETLSSSPTSSHTEFVPATSTASSTVLGPRQAAVPPSQSSQDAEDDDSNLQMHAAPQQQAVALVSPRIEPPSSQEQGTSSSGSSSNNTVTTTQAGHKRQRDELEQCQADEQSTSQQQNKRTRVQQLASIDVELDVEYQVPTSSQSHDEDNVIVVDSDDEVDDEEEDGDGEADEGDGVEEDDQDDADTEGMEQDNNYEDAECTAEQEEDDGNEVEVIEDSCEVPNQSERHLEENSLQEENVEQSQSEAISSGTDGNFNGIVVSQASTSMPSSMLSHAFSRTRPVAPLSRPHQSHLLLSSHGLEEVGDDGIVPSTPTLFVPRRLDGFGEAVSSPHVPTGGRFTFSESTVQSTPGSSEVIPEQTLEILDENSTGRSVPTTPLQSSPQESVPNMNESEAPSSQDDRSVDIPTIIVSDADVGDHGDVELEQADCMGPPAIAGTSSDVLSFDVDNSEGDDEVSSEGEKPMAMDGGGTEEEGREAEASQSTNPRTRTNRPTSATQRRDVRNINNRSYTRSGPVPIVWDQRSTFGRPTDSNTRPRQNTSLNSSNRPGGRRTRGRSPYRRF